MYVETNESERVEFGVVVHVCDVLAYNAEE